MLIQFDRPNLRIDSSRYPQHLVLITLSRNLTPSGVTCEVDSFDQLLAPTRIHYLDGDQRILRATSDNDLQVFEYAVSFESLYDPDTRRRQPFEFRLRVTSLYLEDRNYHTRNVQLLVTFPLVGGVGTLTLNPTAGFQYDIASSVELNPPSAVQLCDANEILTSYRRTHAGRPEAHALREWRIANAALEPAPVPPTHFLGEIEETLLEDLQQDTLLGGLSVISQNPNPASWEGVSHHPNPNFIAAYWGDVSRLGNQESKAEEAKPTSRFDRLNQEELPSDASLDESSPKSGLPLK